MNIKKYLIVLWGSILGFMPALAAAVEPVISGCGIGTTGVQIQNILCRLQDIFGALIPFLIAIGVLYFIWGVIQYVISEDEEAKSRGKDKIVYGLIGLVVIISMWGLVGILQNTFLGTQSFMAPSLPNIGI
ncbi:MAG: hypothetical protein AAB693_00515 [Patescibacteria group bacterium]